MAYGKEELANMLHKIDAEATLALGDFPQKLPVVIVGGSALMLHDLTRRPATHDIDVLSYHEALRDVLANYRAVNSAVMAYMDQVPYNFEDRLVRLPIETSSIEFLTPSLEDLAVMKLYAWRPGDQEDLESPVLLERLDWSKLDHIVYDPGEAQASALSPRRYHEMVAVYEEYARKHGHEPNA